MDQRGLHLMVTRCSTSYIKRILLVEDVDLLITYLIVLYVLLCVLNVERMDIVHGCARCPQKINRQSDIHGMKVTEKPNNSNQRKENQKRKFNLTEGLDQGFQRNNVYSLWYFPFLDLYTIQWSGLKESNRRTRTRKKNRLRVTMDHQTANSIIFTHRHFAVLVQLQTRDSKSQKLEIQDDKRVKGTVCSRKRRSMRTTESWPCGILPLVCGV